ncbi:lipase 2 [Diplocarpon rosae]|nr:lipase 2 [Diplocarpon rosae]
MTFSTARVLRSAFLAGSVVITTVSADVPLVTVLNGTYAGVHSPSYNQDWFLGMPFAYPPVQGPLRLAPPVSLNTSWEGTRDASKFGNTCWGTGNDAERLIGLGLPVSEDCLNINVVRPSNYTDQLLPVAVYIYGGGYHMGGSADPRLNSSYLIQNSISIDKPIVAVSFNYRVSAFGFLAGSALSEAGALNLGFRDQRLALQWIHENIAAFGGDPAKVTIFGESAGAGSVGAQLLAYNGRDDGLFRGAISQSGSPVGFTPWTEFVSGEVWDELERGDFVKVPFMMGTNTDEGSAFVPGSNFDNATFYPMASSKIDTDAEFLGYLASLGANWTVAQEVFDLYPQNATEQVVDTYPNDKGAVLGYQYKRACTFAGDYMMIAPTRYAAQVWAAAGVPPWDHRPASYTDLAYTISTTWAAFVATLDPNVNGTGERTLFPSRGQSSCLTIPQVNGIAAWPVYSIGSPSRFVFDANVTSYVEADTTRKKSIEYLINTFKL